MINLIITEINDDIGPGDIVGAFINEAEVEGDDIGKINIGKKKAEVEVAEKIAKHVVRVMDNNDIGGIKVRVRPEDPELMVDKTVLKYVNKYEELVELEREEEMRRHEKEIRNYRPEEREARGRAILHLRGRDEGTAFGNKPLVKFLRQRRGEELPDTEISVGDLVMISRKNPLGANNPTGTVAEKTRYSISVVFDQEPPSFVYGKGLRLDLYVNDITFQRMLEALGKIKKGREWLEEKRDKLLGIESPEWVNKKPQIDWVNKSLNNSQKDSIIKALKAGDFFLIQGPPGTGKTMTAIEIINQAVKQNQSVLAAADSNIAVDNLVERLANSGTGVLRVGHPLRVTPLLREHTLDYRVLDHPDYKTAQDLRVSVQELLDKQDSLTHPSGRWRRGMSNSQIRKYASQNRASRGVPLKKIKEMADWLNIQDKVDDYFSKINRLEDKAVEELVKNADVICTTNSTAGSELMAKFRFDLVVIDEATQSTEPAALIPLLKGDRAVLIGDHKQLPPTVLNQKAEKNGLSISLFERLYQLHGKEFWSLLEVQYRMHDMIMNFSNQQFYDGRLKSSPAVSGHTLADLGINPEDKGSFIDKALASHSPFVFLDTTNMGADERSLPGSNSYDNSVEAEIVLDIVDEAVCLGLTPAQIAVITPYKDQVDLLSRRNKLENLEINTVDGFQGREKEMVILSLVRSNSTKKIGFLRDLRRINVALTRAKRKLVLIGDSNTITCHQMYENLIRYVKDKGLYYKL